MKNRSRLSWQQQEKSARADHASSPPTASAWPCGAAGSEGKSAATEIHHQSRIVVAARGILPRAATPYQQATRSPRRGAAEGEARRHAVMWAMTRALNVSSALPELIIVFLSTCMCIPAYVVLAGASMVPERPRQSTLLRPVEEAARHNPRRARAAMAPRMSQSEPRALMAAYHPVGHSPCPRPGRGGKKWHHH